MRRDEILACNAFYFAPGEVRVKALQLCQRADSENCGAKLKLRQHIDELLGYPMGQVCYQDLARQFANQIEGVAMDDVGMRDVLLQESVETVVVFDDRK